MADTVALKAPAKAPLDPRAKRVLWLGIVLGGVSVVLFGASALLDGRRRDAPPAALGSSGKSRHCRPERQVTGTGDDLDDIEAILRKHGIS